METNTNSLIDKAQQWLTNTFDNETQLKVKELIKENNQNLTESFYKNLEFGTGGMRGIMGVGTNRINKYTLGKNTQGLSNYLHKSFPDKQPKVAIAFDCRHHSKSLAKIVANVFSANGIKVFLCKDLRPTPVLSFAVRHFDCDAGIVLTASHNPPEYNGYKVYWDDGAQIVPPQDGEIINEINNVKFDEIKFTPNEDFIEYVGKELDDAFIKQSIAHATFGVKNREKTKIVYTSLHGTSITVIPEALKRAGFTDVNIVEEQREPNGDFPTVKSPNPEEPAALKMAIELAEKINADIVIGTDPDSDRIGIAIRDQKGKMKLLNGNQTMVVMSNFLLKKWSEQGKLNGNQFIGSTIVTTSMVDKIAESYGVETKIGLTGFKWIAKMIRDNPNQEFIGGGEESFGFMVGDFVRDKDAVTATLLACEVATDAKNINSSFYNELLKLYVQFGFYKEHLISLVKKGMDGASIINKMMIAYREHPIQTIAGSKVKYLDDYKIAIRKNVITGAETPITVAKSNVLIYTTEDGTKVAVRPSGTEPKIKYYFSVNLPLDLVENAIKTEQQLDAKIQKMKLEMKL